MSRFSRRNFWREYRKRFMLGAWQDHNKVSPKPKPIVNMTKRIANHKPTKYEVSDAEFQLI